MSLVKTTGSVLLCALLLVGCGYKAPPCPQATASFQEIPPGLSHTEVLVEVRNPSPGNGLGVVTKLTAASGAFDDPFAQKATYTCAHDVSGPVEICVNAAYTDLEDEDPKVGVSQEYLRAPHVRLIAPLECSETQCTTIICPEDKNECPVVSSLTIEPMVVPDGGTATIEVVAEDPDDNPEDLVTTLSELYGTIADPDAATTTYTCDPDVGGAIKVCVVASDGDLSCDVEICTSVRCPGDPLDNTCPIIAAFSVDPNPIPPGEETATVRVDAWDPDEFPEPLRTKFTSGNGAFADQFATETTFRCGGRGPIEISVDASDGDPVCNQTSKVTVQCPNDVQLNLCPNLHNINSIPRDIEPGETSTRVETRAQDNDRLPDPLTLTLSALWGSFENTTNIQTPKNGVAQNATYVCDRPGEIEVCVDATDGKCTKTSCDKILCPPDVPTPP